MADRHTPEQRSYNMSRIRAFDSGPERAVRGAVDKLRIRYKANVQSLPGRPDLVFERAKLIVFIDGSFWHGYRLPRWEQRLSPYWRAKIARNRARDMSNHRKLRRQGWRVVRLWDHQIARDLDGCVFRIRTALAEQRAHLSEARRAVAEAPRRGQSR